MMNTINTPTQTTTTTRFETAAATAPFAATPITSAPRATASTLRTPYHALGTDGEMRVPEWAQGRSVYRTGGRTLYFVETDNLDAARLDLARLDRAGWEVRVAEGENGDGARIALTRREFAQAA